MRAPLRGPGVTAEDVMAATEAVAPALEIVDSRIADWRIMLADTIADNASSGAVVLGEWVPISQAPSLPDTTATLVVNDTTVGTGRGPPCGRSSHGRRVAGQRTGPIDTGIEASQFVMFGSYTTAAFVAAGEHGSSSGRT